MRTRGVKTDVDHSLVRPPTQSNRRAAVEKRRKRNEEMQAHEFQQNPVFDEEHDQQPQQDDVFDDEHDQQHQFDDEHGHHHQPKELMFPGGPYDLSVLKDYEHHMTINVWNGYDSK
uniref:Sex-determining region Y protein-like n=1 Tax=Cicer arietinum TaxID=3827 RepID=A0A1S2XGZ4_CICAR|nr:sex-determining region Y protein-like [Cicer arietinum]